MSPGQGDGAGEGLEGEGDSTRPPEPGNSSSASSRGSQGEEGLDSCALPLPGEQESPRLGYGSRGFVESPESPVGHIKHSSRTVPGWVPAAPLCSAQPGRAPRAALGSPERAQRCCHRGRGAGHGAPARPGCQCHWGELLGAHSGTFRLNGRGEVAPARTEQLMVPKPWRGVGGRLRSLP